MKKEDFTQNIKEIEYIYDFLISLLPVNDLMFILSKKLESRENELVAKILLFINLKKIQNNKLNDLDKENDNLIKNNIINAEPFELINPKDLNKGGSLLHKERKKILEGMRVFEDNFFKDFFELNETEQYKIISEIIYILVKISYEKYLNNYKLFLKDWSKGILKCVKESKAKNKRKGVMAENLLLLICGNNKELLEEAIDKDEKWFINRFGSRKKLFVDIYNELDYEDSIKENGVTVNPNELGLITEDEKRILINSQLKSLKEYYKESVYNFNSKTLLSNSLLDKILTVYIIKRAQNGDDTAFEALFRCYKTGAESVAKKFLSKKRRGFSNWNFNPSGQLAEDNVTSVALSILSLVLRGDNPLTLFRNIDNKTPVDVILKRRVFELVFDTYDINLKVTDALLSGTTESFNDFKNKSKNVRNRAKQKKQSGRDDLALNYYKKSIEISLGSFSALTLDVSLLSYNTEPYYYIVSSPKYNSLCYKPNKNHNLTVYLFGTKRSSCDEHKKKFSDGIMFQLLNNWFSSITETRNGKRHIKQDDYASSASLDNNYIERPDDDEEDNSLHRSKNGGGVLKDREMNKILDKMSKERGDWA